MTVKTNSYSTKDHKTYEEFVADRKTYVGASDFASAMGVGRYGCQRKLAYDKLGYAKDFDDSGRMEFRRGRRLEGIAAAFYEEVTGREAWVTVTSRVPGKPHLAVNMDRLTCKVGTKPGENDGYLEIKVVSRFSFLHIKKNGLIDDYILQVQGGCAVATLSWGTYFIYCPDIDEYLCWDVEADKVLGEAALEKADDFWQFHVECKILPEPLPEGSPPCEGCPWAITCRGSMPTPMGNAGRVMRPDLEALAAKLAEIKGMGSECSDAEEELKAEFLAAVKEVPGEYQCGKWLVPFSITQSKRFSGDLLKKAMPEVYERFRIESTTKTLRKPKEL